MKMRLFLYTPNPEAVRPVHWLCLGADPVEKHHIRDVVLARSRSLDKLLDYAFKIDPNTTIRLFEPGFRFDGSWPKL